MAALFRKTLPLVVLAGLLAAPAGTALAADRYVIDTAHSRVGFSVRHLVISDVEGRFAKFSGTILFDPDEESSSSVEVTIDAASIDTAEPGRDEHLRGADFLDTARHPEITFRSEEVRREGSGWVAIGPLTIRGVSKRVVLPFELAGPIEDPWGNTRLGVSSELIIDRRDFGVSWSKTLDSGGLVVGNEIRIQLSVEAVRKNQEEGGD